MGEIMECCDHIYESHCACCINECDKCSVNFDGYPAVTRVLPYVKEHAPKGFVITYEYPNDIGVWHKNWKRDEQMIFLGDVNGYYAFNDQFADEVSDSIGENFKDPEEIAKRFWELLTAYYPNECSPLSLWQYIKFRLHI